MNDYEIRQLVENYYDIQKSRVETFNRIVCWIKENSQDLIASLKSTGIHSIRAIKKLVKKKKYSEIAKLVCKGEIDVVELENLIWFHNQLSVTEKELKKRLEIWSAEKEIRKEFFENVKGIGPILASGLIAYLDPIERFPNVSKLWSYAGLAPGQKRKRGEKLNYNPRLKTLCWKIWNSFVKFDCVGRKLYLKSKKYCVNKHKDWTKLHIHNWAGRRTVKLFLACLWEKWRTLEGLETTPPYPMEYMGHTTLMTPDNWFEKKLGKM